MCLLAALRAVNERVALNAANVAPAGIRLTKLREGAPRQSPFQQDPFWRAEIGIPAVEGGLWGFSGEGLTPEAAELAMARDAYKWASQMDHKYVEKHPEWRALADLGKP